MFEQTPEKMNELELEFTKLVRDYRKTIYTVCYFFSKSRIDHPKDYEGVVKSLSKFGAEGVERFRHWHEIFSV